VLRPPSGDYDVMNISIEERSVSIFDLVFTNSTCLKVASRNVTFMSGSPLPISLTSRNINITFLLDCSFT
jgi:hypothetical protein